VGNKEHVKKAFDLNVDGVSISSCFHYHYLYENFEKIKKNKFAEGNLDFILNSRNFRDENNFSISSLKKYLKEKKINCR
jgi:imidazole glycerol phosphate synthase subunit HisF